MTYGLTAREFADRWFVGLGLKKRERPGLTKFHADHQQMCEICREREDLDEALVEAHTLLSDRVAEVERLRAVIRAYVVAATRAPNNRDEAEIDAASAELIQVLGEEVG
jgi:hypothetical protein